MYKYNVKNMLQNHFSEIKKYKEDGLTDNEIAKIFNTSKSSINRILRANNINSRNLNKVEDVEKDVIKLYVDNKISMKKIGKSFGMAEETISKILHDNNIEIRDAYKTTYVLNDKYFDEILNGSQAYILGLLCADGCVCKNTVSISLQEDDKKILDIINNEFNSNRKLHYIDNSNKKDGYIRKNQYRLAITNKYFANSLRNIGVVDNKSNSLKMLDCINDELLPHFIRGLFDGDGHIEKSRYRVAITGTKYILEELNNRINKILNINFQLYEESNHNGITYCMRIGSKNDCINFLNYIYKDNCGFYIDRKYDLYQKYVNESLIA